MHVHPGVLMFGIAVGILDPFSGVDVALTGLAGLVAALAYRLLLVILLKRDSSKFHIQRDDIYWESKEPNRWRRKRIGP